MPVFRRGRVYWYAFMLRGKRYRGSTKQTTHRAAALFEARLRAQALDRGSIVPTTSVRLIDFWPRFEKWLEDAVAAKTVSRNTQRYYKVGWNQIKNTNLAYMMLVNIDKSVVAATAFRGGPAYCNQAIRTLHRMLGIAVDWHLLTAAPRLRLYHEVARESTIDPAAEAALLPHCDHATRLAVILMQDCGLRRDEVSRSRLDWVDWENAVLYVPDGKTKNARREIPLSRRAYDALLVAHGGRTGGYIFPSRRAKSGHIHPDTLTDGFTAARKSAGLPEDIVLYSARHTFGTAVYGKTGNLKLVMKVMGHGDARTAMRYQHPETETVRAIIDERNGDQMQAVQ